MDEKYLIHAVRRWRSRKARQSLFFPNVYFHQWDIESDLLEISRSSYLTEYEIKISLADLLKEYDKERWKPLTDLDKWRKYGSVKRYKEPKIKKYFFVLPMTLFDKNMARIEEYVRDHHGIIAIEDVKDYMGREFTRMTVVKTCVEDRSAPKLDDSEVNQLLRKIYHRYWNDKLGE